MADTIALSIEDLSSMDKPNWCPGCGDYLMLNAVKKGLVELNIKPENAAIISGIGCGSKFPHHLTTYGFHAIHGRAIPFATGVKLTNPDLTVIVAAGDGDIYGIGGNHFMHGLRRNLDITVLVQNNMIYGLTKGQTSPTSEKGFISKSTPHGNIEEPVHPMVMSLAAGATFVARTFSGDPKHVAEVIKAAIAHNGSALVDMLMPCLSFNKVNTLAWYKERVYKMEGHDKTDIVEAYRRALEHDKFPIGIFYEADKPTYTEELKQLKDKPLVKQDISSINISKAMERYV